DHVEHRTTWGSLAASLAGRRLLGARGGERCGIARRRGRARWWFFGRRSRRLRWRARRWGLFARPGVRGARLRCKTGPTRARRPVTLRVAVLLRPLLRLRPVLS